jgi:signal transduction protein with GAF and PtsI domain
VAIAFNVGREISKHIVQEHNRLLSVKKINDEHEERMKQLTDGLLKDPDIDVRSVHLE